MRTFTSSYIALKNRLENETWCHMVDFVVNANTTAYLTTHPETISFNGNTYMPYPMSIGAEEQSGDGELPSLTIDMANYMGSALRYAKDNDLTLNNVTIRLVNPSLTDSGQDARVRLQVLSAIFAGEVVRVNLGHNFNYDAEGPRLTYNRRDYPYLPYNAGRTFIF